MGMSKIVVVLLLVVLANYTYAADMVTLDTSPVDVENYFPEGAGGDHVNTEFVDGRLQLIDGRDQGWWDSPIFHVDEPDLRGFWNHMEGSSNWDEFGLNLIDNGGMEQDPDDLWWFGSLTGQDNYLWDCSHARSGSCSFQAIETDKWPSNFRSRVVFNAINTWNVDEANNVFPVDNGEIVHFIARIHTDIPQGDIRPSLESIRALTGTQNFGRTNKNVMRSDIRLSSKTSDFIDLQVEFRLDDVYPDTDLYDYYGYPQLSFNGVGPYVEDRKFWIDDIKVFKDSRIKIQARWSNEEDCSGMQSWYSRPERLLYDNEINVPSPVTKCIQFRVKLYKINSGPFTGNTLWLEKLNFTFSKAYDFTRPEPDTISADFTQPAIPVSELGPVSLDESDGEMYFDQSGEQVRFYGFQSPYYAWTDPDFGDKQVFADYMCNYAEKYGFNMIKFPMGIDDTQAEIENIIRYHEPMIELCEEKGVYFFFRFTPLKYLHTKLGNQFCDSTFCGPVEFTDDAVIPHFKDYIDIVLNYELDDGTPIGERESFIMSEIMNEVSLVVGWRHDKLDGVNGATTLDNFPDISPYYANSLRELFNEWLWEKYPTYAELTTAWDDMFVPEDGNCNAATYESHNLEECELQILLYSEYFFLEECDPRMDDILEFLIQREEYLYTEIANHIESNSHMIMAGGKPFWGIDPAGEAGMEVLKLIDGHPYGNTQDSFWTDDETYLLLTNQPLMRRPDMNYVNSPRFAKSAYVAGETAYSPFSENVAEYMLTSIIGANSGWDASILFMMKLNREYWQKYTMHGFSLQYQAPVVAMQPVSSRLFRRDMQTGETKKMYMTRETTKNYDLMSPFYHGYKDPANQFIYNIVWESMKHTSDILPAVPDNQVPPYQSSSGDFVYDIENRRVKVTTDMTKGIVGDYDGYSEDVGFMSVDIEQVQGTPSIAIFITSLDDIQLTQSKEMLLTAVSNADNSDHIWDHYHRRAECEGCNSPNGVPPVWMGSIDAQITIQGSDPIIVHPLNINGQKGPGAFIVNPVDDQLTFQISGEFKTPWYIIEVQDEQISQEVIMAGIVAWFNNMLSMSDLIQLLQAWKSIQ
ncbi:MAG: hypothetical protein KKG59_01280 [Nanoarchaeota archaeon]|nr:hypothetical protein [Nanoarchaeota archaeon]